MGYIAKKDGDVKTYECPNCGEGYSCKSQLGIYYQEDLESV